MKYYGRIRRYRGSYIEPVDSKKSVDLKDNRVDDLMKEMEALRNQISQKKEL
jgi:hypothetical protein